MLGSESEYDTVADVCDNGNETCDLAMGGFQLHSYGEMQNVFD